MIKTINVGEETLTGSDISIKEKIDFIENMTEKQLEKILTFYTNAPSLDHKFKHTINDEEKEFELRDIHEIGVSINASLPLFISRYYELDSVGKRSILSPTTTMVKRRR